MSERGPLLVVLAPDLIGATSFDSDCAAVLGLWREGRIRPVVNQALLRRYLRLLRRLGLSEELLRWWGWWFNAADRATFLPGEEAPGQPTAVLCAQIAQDAQAESVVHAGFGMSAPSSEANDQKPAPWLSAGEFWRRFSRPAADAT